MKLGFVLSLLAMLFALVSAQQARQQQEKGISFLKEITEEATDSMKTHPIHRLLQQQRGNNVNRRRRRMNGRRRMNARIDYRGDSSYYGKGGRSKGSKGSKGRGNNRGGRRRRMRMRNPIDNTRFPTFVPIGCPFDVLTCPDGTVLVRDPLLNCAFPPCPDTPLTPSTNAPTAPGSTGPTARTTTGPTARTTTGPTPATTAATTPATTPA